MVTLIKSDDTGSSVSQEMINFRSRIVKGRRIVWFIKKLERLIRFAEYHGKGYQKSFRS